MEQFSAQREFSAYGPSHLAVLAVFVIGAAALVWIGRQQTESQARIFGRVFAVLIVAAIHRGAGLQTDPARHGHFGTAAAVRCRGTDGGLCAVVATALGLCAELLLVPRPQLTGVDHTRRRHARRRRARFPAPPIRSRSSRFTCSWSGRRSI